MPLLSAHAKFCLGVHLKFIMKGLKFFLDANFLSSWLRISLTLMSVAPGLLVFKFK